MTDSTSMLILLGTADYTEAKRLQGALEERGIPLKLVAPPETCGPAGGCKPKLEMYAAEADAPAIQEFLRNEFIRDSGGLEIDPTLLGEVFDPEKELARCPACGESFSTQIIECPGCGLHFGGPAPG